MELERDTCVVKDGLELEEKLGDGEPEIDKTEERLPLYVELCKGEAVSEEDEVNELDELEEIVKEGVDDEH